LKSWNQLNNEKMHYNNLKSFRIWIKIFSPDELQSIKQEHVSSRCEKWSTKPSEGSGFY